MVGPVSREERLAASRRFKIGFVLLVGVSAGLITAQGNPTLPVVALAVLVGLVVGVLLVLFAFPKGFSFRD